MNFFLLLELGCRAAATDAEGLGYGGGGYLDFFTRTLPFTRQLPPQFTWLFTPGKGLRYPYKSPTL